jgi:hypothetical protein
LDDEVSELLLSLDGSPEFLEIVSDSLVHGHLGPFGRLKVTWLDLDGDLFKVFERACVKMVTAEGFCSVTVVSAPFLIKDSY